ncbi:anti sigma factor [Amycolatopsis methanolica 239]|uniref:Anti sigma factor n=1 Tax=Amycolatopsis methanolica 239 TaxID=1068978 RepID=A0A076N375_AMYME|nr:anti sigma factor [Amycolatopsis methanolica 239]
MHAGDQRLHRLVTARSRNATTLRHVLTQWANAVELPDATTDAMALAAYEAMINVVTHAYPARADGPLELSAELRGNAVDVTVSDQGRWQPPAADPGPLHGRGLPLIHALSDRAEIAPGPEGTTVRMRWPVPPTPVRLRRETAQAR